MSRPLEQQIIERAHALIARPESWTRGAFALDAGGDPVSWRSPNAARFCLWGALNRAAFELTGDKRQSITLGERAAATLRAGKPSLSLINDHGTHTDVLELFTTYMNTKAITRVIW
jgi:hypothetical protein